MTDTICSGIDEKFGNELSKMRRSKNVLYSKVNDLKDKMDSLVDLSDIDNAKDDISSARIDIAHQMNDIEDTVSNIAGSCLDGVFNEINNVTRNLNGYIDGLLPKNFPELDILSGIGVLSGILDSLGISSLIGTIDELLGCLSDSDCIPIDDVQDYYDEINLFVDTTGLTDEGGFDQDTFLDKMNVTPKAAEGINNFKDDMKNFKNEVANTVSNTTENVKKISQPKTSVSSNLF